MTEHELKTWPEYFEALVDGSKTFEYRVDDRGFKVGDTLKLREYVPEVSTNFFKTGEYTGRELIREVTYILTPIRDNDGRFENVILGIRDPADNWKEQCHDQAEQLVKLSDMLLKLEWVTLNGEHFCPRCYADKPHHASICNLNKLLEPYR